MKRPPGPSARILTMAVLAAAGLLLLPLHQAAAEGAPGVPVQMERRM